jgi:NADH:ubiquinone oxidoreductase subunit 6 (subunit J)
LLVQLLFYGFSLVLLAAALGVITLRNPVHSALCLVLTFFTAAAIWLLVEAEFLAIVLVLVYVGAVMVLFLFVVMMLDINIEELRSGFTKHLALGVATALILFLEIVGVVVAAGEQCHRVGHCALHQVHLSLRARRCAAAGGHHCRHRADHAASQGPEGAGYWRPGGHTEW